LSEATECLKSDTTGDYNPNCHMAVVAVRGLIKYLQTLTICGHSLAAIFDLTIFFTQAIKGRTIFSAWMDFLKNYSNFTFTIIIMIMLKAIVV